ncbi:MAG: RHS repeat-associated core domain-containing protein [Desulfobacterales bacterium]|nr:RHS repeat-associated core domain-containing protein [Desulfobacterales bacterium]
MWKDRTRLLAVYDGSNNLKMRFEYADGRMPVTMTADSSVYYLTYDQVGSLRVVTDASGTVVKKIDYDSFGNIYSDSNSTFEVPFGFAGGLHDRDTELVRFGYRDYDSGVGRWTAKDPIGFAGGDTDLYGYCIDDPVNLIDPLGLISPADAIHGGLAFWGAASLSDGPIPIGEIVGGVVFVGSAIYAGYLIATTNEACEDEDRRHSPDQEALNDLIGETTLGGRRPLSDDEADTVLDWADEVGTEGARDDRNTNHWTGGQHIHVPGSGIGHIPTGSR